MSYIKLDKNKCKSCYLCIDVCPKNCIRKSETIGKTGEYVCEFIDNNECLACSRCAVICPEIAITEVVKTDVSLNNTKVIETVTAESEVLK